MSPVSSLPNSSDLPFYRRRIITVTKRVNVEFNLDEGLDDKLRERERHERM